MADFRKLETRLAEHLRLRRRPVAISYRSTPPAGIGKFAGTVPSGCSFWKLAADGRSFYTEPGDHYNCPIGAHTHNIALPPERAGELEDTLKLMASVGYVRMEEVPGILRIEQPPSVVTYTPLGETPDDPDIVLFSERASTVMRLQEAAIRAGIASQLNLLARPTCMLLPATLQSGLAASSGCVGNRVYTAIDDEDLYVGTGEATSHSSPTRLLKSTRRTRSSSNITSDRRERLTAVV